MNDSQNANRQWFGNLTLANIEDFTERLRTMLAGKRFTFISVNGSRGYEPEIRINQQLEGRHPVGGYRSKDGAADNISLYPESTYGEGPSKVTWRSLNVCDSYGVWSLNTHETYFSFEPEQRDQPERLTITHKNGAGDTLHWLICVESKPVVELIGTVGPLSIEDSGTALIADLEDEQTVPDDGCFFVRLHSTQDPGTEKHTSHQTLLSLKGKRVRVAIEEL